MFGYGESLKEKTNEVLKTAENLVDMAFKVSGGSFMDCMSGLDVEQGAAVGAAMTIYGKTKELAVMQAEALDQIVKDLNELKEENKELMRNQEKILDELKKLNAKKS